MSPVSTRPRKFAPEPNCPGAAALASDSGGSGSSGGGGDDEEVWGFKSPHSIFFLSFYQASLGKRWRFLHVVRDGRDVAFSDDHVTQVHGNTIGTSVFRCTKCSAEYFLHR